MFKLEKPSSINKKFKKIQNNRKILVDIIGLIYYNSKRKVKVIQQKENERRVVI